MITLNFNSIDSELKIDEAVKNCIRELCQPSYEGVSNDDDLYCIDYVIERLENRITQQVGDDQAEFKQTLEQGLSQIKALECQIDYLCINKS